MVSPFELVTGDKPDYRQLFPLFSVAYMKYAREEKKSGGKWKSQTLKVIAVGSCPVSDSLLFYHPPSKQLFSGGDGYKFDYYYPSGPQFDLIFDGAFIFTNQASMSNIHHTPTHEENKEVYIDVTQLHHSNEKEEYNNLISKHDFLGKASDSSTACYEKGIVLSVPIDEDNECYTIQLQQSDAIVEVPATEVYDTNPTEPPVTINTPTSTFLPWITHGSKVTMFLSDKGWRAPQQGHLIHQRETDEWYFQKGRKLYNSKHEKLLLPQFLSTYQSMIQNKKLFQGWISFDKVKAARLIRATSNILAFHIIRRHVSAAELDVMTAPTLTKHHKLSAKDKQIWDDSYAAEYEGLVGIDTWDVINKSEYKNLLKTTNLTVIPTMAISIIKYDGEGKPIRAKYRIVALGNLDTNLWTKSDCFAPVLSQFEMRLLIAIAAQLGCIPLSADVAQAFCHAYLPPDEQYIAIPPAGCPITPQGSYWKLKKTLYGLKKSPRHWYEKAKELLETLGLHNAPHSPCIFTGELIKGQAPIYVRLYVDDLLYFSPSNEVQEAFETQFGNLISTTFNGTVDYFLGVKFTHTRHSPTSVTINMTQTAFIDNLVHNQQLDGEAVIEPKTPYCSGYVIDSIPQETYSPTQQFKYTALYQHLIGSLNWLAISTRPDIATATNMLAKYMSEPSLGHIHAAKHFIKYLKGTRQMGISFTTSPSTTLRSFVKFPHDQTNKLFSMSDANWGPQDQSSKRKNQSSNKIDIFKTWSISGYILWLGGPIHWSSKR